MLFIKFAEAGRTSRTHNLHVSMVEGDLWYDGLVFRNHFLSYPEAAREYACFKHAATKGFHDNHEAYTRAKADFISATLERARASRA